MAKNYEQVIEALRKVGAEHLEEARACFVEHSNWLAIAVNQAREQIAALKGTCQTAGPHNEKCGINQHETKPEENGVKTRRAQGRKRRGNQRLCSIQEEDENNSPNSAPEETSQKKRHRSLSDGAAKASRSPPEPKDEVAGPSNTAEEKASSKDAPSRPGRPPRPPRKGRANNKSAQDSQTTEDQSDMGTKAEADPPPAEAKGGRRTRRNAAEVQEGLDAPPANGLGTRQTRSRTAAASVATTTSKNTAGASVSEDAGKKRSRRGVKKKAGAKESPAPVAKEQSAAETTCDTAAPQKEQQQDAEQDAGCGQCQGDCIAAPDGATTQTVVDDTDLEQPEVGVPDGAVPSAVDDGKRSSPSEPVSGQQEDLDDPGLDPGYSSQEPASVSSRQPQGSEHASQADAPSTSIPADVPSATHIEEGEACADSAMTGTRAPSSTDLQIGDGTDQRTDVQSAERCTALLAEVGSHRSLGSTHSIAVSDACSPPAETACPDAEATQEDDLPVSRGTEGRPHHLRSPDGSGKDKGHEATDTRRPSEAGAMPGNADVMTAHLIQHVRSPAGPAVGVAEVSGRVQDGTPQNVVCTEITASPNCCSVTGQADVNRDCSLHGTAGAGPVSASQQDPERPSSQRNSSVSLQRPSERLGADGDQTLRDNAEQESHLLSNERQVLSGRDTSMTEGGAAEIGCLEGPNAPEAPQPIHNPVQNSKLGFGANLVSTVRSFLPFVNQSAADAPTAVAAGKAQVKVKALEVAEALKRKEAAKAAQRAKMKEDILKQKAERNKVKKEAEQENEAQRRKEILLKKDEEAAARRKAKELAEKKEREEKTKRNEQIRLKAAHGQVVVTKGHVPQEGDLRGDKRGVLNPVSTNSMVARTGASALASKPKGILQGTGHVGQQAGNKKSTDQKLCTNAGQSNFSKGDERTTASALCDAKHPEAIQSYEMSPYRGDSSDEDSDEDERSNKPVPDWARGRSLLSQLIAQVSIDPDEVFQQHSTTCPLDAVFGHADPEKGKKKDLSRRGSSGNWIEDRVTWKEEMAYKRAMGYL